MQHSGNFAPLHQQMQQRHESAANPVLCTTPLATQHGSPADSRSQYFTPGQRGSPGFISHGSPSPVALQKAVSSQAEAATLGRATLRHASDASTAERAAPNTPPCGAQDSSSGGPFHSAGAAQPGLDVRQKDGKADDDLDMAAAHIEAALTVAAQADAMASSTEQLESAVQQQPSSDKASVASGGGCYGPGMESLHSFL